MSKSTKGTDKYHCRSLVVYVVDDYQAEKLRSDSNQ